MKNKITSIIMALVMISSVFAVLVGPVSSSISPEEITATLAPCESINETKTVEVPALPPKVDVVFAFDLTGSMSNIIDTVKSNATDIMDQLDTLGIDIQYGVMSYMDYPDNYTSCGYSAEYGNGSFGDYAYSLNQSVTDDRGEINNTINNLSLGNGEDGPQDYTRIFYESYADLNVGWRPGAKRILVNFGDNVPHDCNLNESVPGTTGTWSTGGDPGRDELMGTADDLDLQEVLANMSANGTVLIECHTANWTTPSGLGVFDYWEYWTNITGGDVYNTSSATLVDDVVNAINKTLTAQPVSGLHLNASSGFEVWLKSVEPDSHDIPKTPANVTFNVTIHVPMGTSGEYTFNISALDENNVNYGDQIVTITVNQPPNVTDAYPSIDCLWPPNHKFVDITIEGVTDPDGDVVTITITNITSDEPTASIKGAGGDKHAPDADGVGTDTASLRAERSGTGNGRVYEITFVASDGIAETEGSVTVCVPHDYRGKCTCGNIDDGQNYDATQINV
jgi:hypothetical protein